MSGLNRQITKRKYDHYSESEKRTIIEDYLQSGMSKRAIWKKYTGQSSDHGLLLYWMYKYGYSSVSDRKIVTFVSETSPMKKEERVSDFEYQQLKNRVLDLEKRLRESEMQTIACQTMIELAEREFNIRIKKKFNTKPSEK